MRPLILLPAAAFLALAACGEEQEVAQTEPEATTTAPADTAAAPPPPATDTAPPVDTATAPPPPAMDTSPSQDTAAVPPASTGTTSGSTMADPQATGAVSAGGSIEPGMYQSQNVSLNLEQDGTFLMTNPATGDEAQGEYQLQDDVLTLMTEGSTAEPMTCDVVAVGDGFEISASDASCEPLDGESFERQS